MGAIWGTVAFNNGIDKGFEKMQPTFEKKCRLDLYHSEELGHCKMGAGVLFVRGKDREECLPIKNKEHYIILTADCLLDNSDELEELLGMSNLTDGQIIMEMYLKYGVEAFEKLRGLFSIAIWNEKEQKLILVSDPVSSRCLYYYRIGNSFYFSTLIEPMREAVGGLEINRNYLEDFLMAPGLMPNLFSDYTPYKNVMKCEPGEWLEIGSDGISAHSYYDFSLKNGEKLYGSNKDIGRCFRNIFEDCVRDAIKCDGDVSASMSSGLDSASVATMAAKELSKEGRTLRAYTYVPSEKSEEYGNKDFVVDETEDVKTICAPYENIVNEFLCNESKNCFDDVEEIVNAMEIPFKAFVNFPNLCEIFSKASESGCKVVLTGQVGNSTISHGFIDDVLFDFYEKKKYISFLLFLNKYCKKSGESRKKALKGCIGYFEYTKKILKEGVKDYPNPNHFLSKAFVDSFPFRESFRRAGIHSLQSVPMNETFYKEFLFSKAMYTYIGEYETKLGLKYGIVIRDVTKDARLIKFCNAIPYYYFAFDGVPRWLVRENLKDMIPEEILGNWFRYGVQNADWLRRIERDWNERLLRERLLQICETEELRDFTNREAIKDFVDDPWKEKTEEVSLKMSEIGYIYVLNRFIFF